MPIEDEKQNIENENDETSDELLDLKKDLASKIVDKLLEKDLSISSYLFKGSIADYLVNDDTFSDKVHDELLIGNFGEEAGIITPELKKYREMISNAKTKDDLENLKTTIFNELGQNKQESNTGDTDTENSTTESGGTTTKTAVLTTSVTTGAAISSGSTEKAKVNTSSESYELDHFNITASAEAREIWDNLRGKEKPDLEPFACAMKAYKTEKAKGHLKNTKYLTVVDFTKNMQTDKRFFVINLDTKTVEYAEKCGHGEGSGGREWTTSFSNKSGSHQSSLGASITPDKSRSNGKGTWVGSFPKGQEKSNNASRGIAIHPVKSLTYKSGKSTSEGCFTIPTSQKHVNKILDKINGGSLVFAYAKSKDYFAQSDYFQQNADSSIAA